ncbi:heparinase II/III family protein [Hymenobacter daeguensis]
MAFFIRQLRYGLLAALLPAVALAQTVQLPATLPAGHPRLLTNAAGKDQLRQRLATQPEAQRSYNSIKAKVDPYVTRHQTDPTWIVSRLQMYWKTRATEVYVKGPVFDHAGGPAAPAPTVRFTGTRDAVTVYRTPAIEDVKPYLDDARGLYLQNATTKQWEWTDPAKAARIVEGINRNIMALAQQSAFLYWYTGEEKYARFAYDVLDTYLTGIYYRQEPVDLSHSHIQTLVGLTSFEVIHEDVLSELVPAYDFLHDYVVQHAAPKKPLYDAALQKWADLIIKNGVPFNNWDLFEARFVSQIAVVLDDDDKYANGHGSHYYLDQIINQTSTRQWGLTELIRKGFDAKSGLWAECPGYSVNVVKDFTDFVKLFDELLHIDLAAQIPLIPKAVLATAQYAFPNGNIVGFGDTHYGPLPTESMLNMVANAQHFHKPEQERQFTSLLKTTRQLTGQAAGHGGGGSGVAALFASATVLRDDIPAARPGDFVTPTFYSPNVSWLVQRLNPNSPRHGLLISQAGSMGNHAHANGIAMELYGQGVVLAPEGGIGTTYFQPDYAEYYSQFPAHNTVMVDGISAYPVMKSNHGFAVQGVYPPISQAGTTPTYGPFTYSDVLFREPETQSDQRRQMGIIRTGDSTGYYVDIFRSKKVQGGDKFHDYFFHGLGQELTVGEAGGKALALQPTAQLAFAEGSLFALDYLYDKKSVLTTSDVAATFRLAVPNQPARQLHMWLQGAPEREIFTMKSPKSTAYGRDNMLPHDIEELPLPTIVVRQRGQAWTRPFAVVYESAATDAPRTIKSTSGFQPGGAGADFVGLKVETVAGRQDYIFSNTGSTVVTQDDMTAQADYAVVSFNDTEIVSLLLGHGREVSKGVNTLAARNGLATAAFYQQADGWHLNADQPVSLTLRGSAHTLVLNGVSYSGKVKKIKGQPTATFELPTTTDAKLELH